MDSVDVCLLGTASGLPVADRFGQTTVITTSDGGHYLIDAGDGASSLLARKGFDHREIRAIVISHMHGDHHGGLIQVLKTNMHLGRRDELIILAPDEGIRPLQAYLDASYLYPDWLGYPIRWESLVSIAKGAGYELPSVRIHAYANDHLGHARDRLTSEGTGDHGRTFESYSFSIEGDGVRVIHSGNLRGPFGADEMEAFVEPANLLICELAHVDPAPLGRFLADKQIDQTVLAHIHPRWLGTPDSEILFQVRRGAEDRPINGRLDLAHDGHTFSVFPRR